jgi:hypothetical protein
MDENMTGEQFSLLQVKSIQIAASIHKRTPGYPPCLLVLHTGCCCCLTSACQGVE